MAATDTGAILEALGGANLTAAAAIAVVVLIRKPARRLFGARFAYGLWLLPLLAAVAVLLPAREMVVTLAESVQAPLPPAVVPAGPMVIIPNTGVAINSERWAFAIWAFGVLASLSALVVLQWRAGAAARDGVLGPAVVGVLFPRIVTPRDFADRFSEEERDLVLAHEQIHVERQHSRVNALMAALQCLCWFNPLVHLASHLMRIDQEMACDEMVTLRFPQARRVYAQALVKAQLATRPLPLGCYWPSSTEHPLFERIAMIKANRTGPVRRLAGGLSLGLLLTAGAVTVWASQPPVTVYAQAGQKIAALIPEMMPTGVMIPAYGSHAPGTPAAVIATQTPEMTPTGALRPIFDEATSAEWFMQAAQAPAPDVYPMGIQNGLTRAEASGKTMTVEGTIARVEWINPQAIITLIDANGSEIKVASETPNSLMRQGVNRDALRAGRTIRIDGFAGENGLVQARAVGFTSEGQRLATSDNTGQPLAPGAAPGTGRVIERSPLTNSVVREGASASRDGRD